MQQSRWRQSVAGGTMLFGLLVAAQTSAAQGASVPETSTSETSSGGSVRPAVDASRRQPFTAGMGAAGGKGTGLGVHGLLGYTVPLLGDRLGVRFDVSYSQWEGASSRVTAGTASGMYEVPVGPMTTYALVGVGLYAQPGSGAQLGWNVGAGLQYRFGPVTPFLEVREHFWPSGDPTRGGQRAMPIIVGVRF